MNIEELFRTHFGPDGAKLLGDAIDLNEERAVPLVDRVVRWQFETLAQHAKSETGRANIIDAIVKMPPFATVEQGLTEQGGKASLLQAGQYLAPLVLGDDQQDIAGQIARVEGVPQPIVHSMMTITLPLLISFAGQKGLGAHNITSIMSTVRASGLRPRPAGGSYVSRAAAMQGDPAKKAAEVELPQTAKAQPLEAINKPSFVADEELNAKATVAATTPEAPKVEVKTATKAEANLPKAPALAPAATRTYQKEEMAADLLKQDEKALGHAAAAGAAAVVAAGTVAAAVKTEAPELTKVDAPELTKVETPEVRKVEAPELIKVETPELTKVEAPEVAKVQTPEVYKQESTQLFKTEEKAAEKPAEKVVEEAEPIAKAVASPAKSAPTAASLAEAAAAAGVGAGAVTAGAVATAAARAEKRASSGSAWKSAPLRVAGSSPSTAKSTATTVAAAASAPAMPAAVAAAAAVATASASASKPAIETGNATTSTTAAVTTAVATTSTGAPANETTTVAQQAAEPAANAKVEKVAEVVPAVAAVAAVAGTAAVAKNADELVEYIRGLFVVPEAAGLAKSVGFSDEVAGEAVQGSVPVLLRAIAQKGETTEGAAEIAKISEGFAHVLKDGKLNEGILKSRPELGALEVKALTVVHKFLDNPARVSGRLASALGGSGEQMGRLLMVTSPVLLGSLAPVAKSLGDEKFSALLRDLTPERIKGLLSPETNAVGALLATQLYGAEVKEKESATLLETKKAKAAGATPPSVPVGRATAPSTPSVPPTSPQPTTPPPAQQSSGGFPWWVVAALLLGLGGCYIANQNKQPAAPTPAPSVPASNTPAATENVYRVEGDSKRELPLEPFELSGLAKPNETVAIVNAAGEELAIATADASGKWTAQLPAPLLGSNSYKLRDSSGKVHDPALLEVTGVAAAAESSTADDSNKGVYSIAQPAAGQSYTDKGFELMGTAEPNGTYQLLENGVSVGTFTADASGAWKVNVPPAQAGDHVYSVVKEDGTEVISLPLQIVASAPAASCTDEYSLSLNDGQKIDAPFRFGGVGQGSGYRVKVLRDGKQIGSKDIPLQPNCTWNYLSQPGGTAGQEANITYEVVSLDAPDAVLSNITLSVKQAGQR